MTAPIRVLVVDDEPPARRRIRELLEDEPDALVAGEAGDGRTAVDMIRTIAPDLVFLDIQMPELNGLDVVAAVGPDRMPPVIFVTAFDRYAVQAFDVAAIDYLLKPFDRDRFQQALERGREQLRRPDALVDRLRHLLGSRTAAPATDRIPVRVGGRIRLIPVDDIEYVTAAGSYVRLHTATEALLIRESLTGLEERLDEVRFARLHRSLIVNIGRVRELEPLYRGEFVLWMRDGARFVTGRSYRDRVRQAFGI
jgi:two-component system, LytTR family, response regulator